MPLPLQNICISSCSAEKTCYQRLKAAAYKCTALLLFVDSKLIGIGPDECDEERYEVIVQATCPDVIKRN